MTMGKMTERLGHILLLLMAVTTMACDQTTKHLARSRLLGAARHSYLGDTIRLEYVENAGAFLGVGSALPSWARKTLFTAGTAAVLVGLLAACVNGRWTFVERMAIGMAWAGGASNLIDRVLHGRVSDFLNVGVGWLRTGVFNVADMAIMLALLLMVCDRARRGLSSTGDERAR